MDKTEQRLIFYLCHFKNDHPEIFYRVLLKYINRFIEEFIIKGYKKKYIEFCKKYDIIPNQRILKLIDIVSKSEDIEFL
ncbi:MAG TPA: hypothetical protein ENG63_09770 [Candidatus Desulfofervidus auxilii]|uniref:Uncharacterized protein n=1 Tax=Desulfofervidus auxilii TaxID=1621989 RepID=A0A7C0Y6M9_DESA2|nr:hypothetical protein [Candidatus Desulfofervidus auxilii]